MKNVSNTLNEIRLAGIIKESIVDGPGLRYVIFTQGCLKRCFLCHNAKTQSLDGGYFESLDKMVNDFKSNPILQGITISGGEPFLQPEAVLYLVKKAKEIGLDVIVYSGYYYHELKKYKNEFVQDILKTADYLIDGPFEAWHKSLSIHFRGSTNQRIIDLRKTTDENNLYTIESFEY